MPEDRSPSPERTVESPAESSEDHDDAHVREQACPEVVSEEEDIDTDHYENEREHVDHDGEGFAHVSCLSVDPSCEKGLNVDRSP